MTIKSLLNESELLAKVAEGDQRAFTVLYEKYNPKIFTFAFRILQSEALAEEVVQETLLKLWQIGPQAIRISHLDAYLRTTARNRSIDLLRRQQLALKAEKELSYEWDESHNETEERIILNETKKILQEAVALLPEQHKLVYQLCHQEGLKYEQAAEKLNLSALTVQTYMKLSLRFLRKYVRTHIDIAAVLIVLKLF